MGLKVGVQNLYSFYFSKNQIVIVEDQGGLNYKMRNLEEEYQTCDMIINSGSHNIASK